MSRSLIVIAVVAGCFSLCRCQPLESDSLLLQLMKREPDRFQYALDHRNELEIQVIYTQINRDANNMPVFRSFYYNVDSNRYFYPASTVKLPMVLLALEKLHRLNIPGLDKFTPMFSDSVYSGHEPVQADTTSETGLPSIAHYSKKILITSDNDAYNRLYEFMGQRAANEILNEKGYSIRLLHRLDRALSPDENRHTEPIRFVRNDRVVYQQPMLVADSIPVPATVLKGVAYYRNDTLIHEPFDFSYKNFFPLTSQQHLLRTIIFPQSVRPQERFAISEDDRRFVLQYMSQLPTETKTPSYFNDTTYFPAYCKYLLYGHDRDSIPSSIRIFNKVGDAYGYLIDNAYIVDFDHDVEFMLSAVIHANTDGIYNAAEYQYKTIGYPFMKNLGQMVLQYERERKRPRKPDLSEFRFRYEIDFATN